MITQSEFNVKLHNILIDTKYVPEWVYKFAVKTNYIDITHKCFHIRIYKNNLNIVFVEKLKVLLTKLHDLLKLTNKRINIILLLSRKKKRINIGEIFKSENINSGLSISTLNPIDIHIIVYRLEDIFKVIIHEIVHYVGLDLQHIERSIINKIDDLIKSKYKSMHYIDLYINEAYTEAMALWYYCRLMKRNFKLEQDHSIKQTKMFLIINGCDTLDSFQKKKIYKEESHAFAYILLKSALIHSDFFLKNMVIASKDEDVLYKCFKKAISNSDWISKVDNCIIDKRMKSFDMNLVTIINPYKR